MAALRGLGDLRDPDAAGAWLRGIVRYVCLTRLRERRPSAPLDREPAAAGPSPEEVVDANALRDWVWTALDGMSEPLRPATMLRYFSRTSSYSEIAQISGVPVGTVRSRLNMARHRLADALLESAALAHREAAALVDDRRRHFDGAFSEYNRGIGCEQYVSACTDDVRIGEAGQPAAVSPYPVRHGRSLGIGAWTMSCPKSPS